MKKIVFLSIIIILLFVIVHLVTSIYTLWHKQDLLTDAKMQLIQEQKQNQQLHQQLTKVKTPQFFEQEARDKLLLVKPGEADVLIDQSLLQASSSAGRKAAPQPFWQQWVELFF